MSGTGHEARYATHLVADMTPFACDLQEQSKAAVDVVQGILKQGICADFPLACPRVACIRPAYRARMVRGLA
jgi:hypothetical protein